MSSRSFVDMCVGGDNLGEVEIKAVKLEPNLFERSKQKQKECQNDPIMRSNFHCRGQAYEENRSSSALSFEQSRTSCVDQEQSPVDDMTLCSSSPISATPLCRQFWKAGNYEHGSSSKSIIQNGTSYLHIHPKFLHSNATSHKWAFGAIAELLDNAVDEIQNGATFVIVDKTLNPKGGSPALLIQDDGGGMDLEAIQRCLSFGFSDKKSKSTIGQYGNGFKTSSMRLGADVIVFSRHMKNRKLTQSIGLLSYTFLTRTCQDRIVVPMVDYEFDESTGTLNSTDRHHEEHFMSNLSMLLQWSPYSTEVELLKQFDDIGYHGTKVVIYNLWYNNEGNLELDFESDPEDIRIADNANIIVEGGSQTPANKQHLANRIRYSLRAYLSILYLRMPQNFCILLRERVVEYHNIGSGLKFPEFIVYTPQNGGCLEGEILTTIGFLKEAPDVNIHGFNVYHKNRLIMPFWQVVKYSRSRGRGVVGVLEANFMEPTHNKQEFEKTPVFQKLESRLKDMTWEYWDQHCQLIGYHKVQKKHPQIASQASSDIRPYRGTHQPVVLSKSFCAGAYKRDAPVGNATQHRVSSAANGLSGAPQNPVKDFHKNSKKLLHLKRKEHEHPSEPENRRKAGLGASIICDGSTLDMLPAITTENQLRDQEVSNLIQENKKLHAVSNLIQENKKLRSQCLQYGKMEKELNLKVSRLRTELGKFHHEYALLLAEIQSMDKVKAEKSVIGVFNSK